MKHHTEVLLYFTSESNIEFVDFLVENIPHTPKKKWRKGEKASIQNRAGDKVYPRSLCQYSLESSYNTIEVENCLLKMCEIFSPYIEMINNESFMKEVNVTLMLKVKKKKLMQPFSLNTKIIDFLHSMKGVFEVYV